MAGSNSVAGVVQHVAGHPDRGERRAQLVGDVGDEPALHPAELLELPDLALQVGGHLVERRRQPGEVVLAGHPQPLLSRPAASRSATRRASRTGVTTWRVTSQVSPATSTSSSTAGGEQRPGDQARASPAARRAGTGSRACRSARPPAAAPATPTTIPGSRADARCRRRRSCRSGCRSRPTSSGGRRSAPRRRDGTLARSRCGLDSVAAVGDPAGRAPDRAGGHDLVAAGRAPLHDEVDQVAALRRSASGSVPGVSAEPLVGLVDLVGDLGHDLVDPVLEQAVAGLLQQEPADPADHDRREQHRADHDPGLDRPAPEGQRPAYGRGAAAAARGPAATEDRRLYGSRPCSRRRGRSPRSPGSRGRARPWSAAAGRAR